MKYLVIALLVIVGLVVAYFTFVIASIKIVIGSILLGVAAIALFAVWTLWKLKD